MNFKWKEYVAIVAVGAIGISAILYTQTHEGFQPNSQLAAVSQSPTCKSAPTLTDPIYVPSSQGTIIKDTRVAYFIPANKNFSVVSVPPGVAKVGAFVDENKKPVAGVQVFARTEPGIYNACVKSTDADSLGTVYRIPIIVVPSTLVLFVPGIGTQKGQTDLGNISNIYDQFKDLRKKIFIGKKNAEDSLNIADIEMFTYDGLTTLNATAANELNSYLSSALQKNQIDRLILISVSVGEQVSRNAVLRATDDVKKLWKTANIFAIHPVIGGVDYSNWLTFKVPGITLVPVVKRINELNPSDQNGHQRWLYSQTTVAQFNSSISNYHVYEVAGSPAENADPLLRGLFNCWSKNSVDRAFCFKDWRDNYLRAIPNDTVEYYIGGHKPNAHDGVQQEVLNGSYSSGLDMHTVLLSYMPLIHDRILADVTKDFETVAWQPKEVTPEFSDFKVTIVPGKNGKVIVTAASPEQVKNFAELTNTALSIGIYVQGKAVATGEKLPLSVELDAAVAADPSLKAVAYYKFNNNNSQISFNAEVKAQPSVVLRMSATDVSTTDSITLEAIAGKKGDFTDLPASSKLSVGFYVDGSKTAVPSIIGTQLDYKPSVNVSALTQKSGKHSIVAKVYVKNKDGSQQEYTSNAVEVHVTNWSDEVVGYFESTSTRTNCKKKQINITFNNIIQSGYTEVNSGICANNKIVIPDLSKVPEGYYLVLFLNPATYETVSKANIYVLIDGSDTRKNTGSLSVDGKQIIRDDPRANGVTDLQIMFLPQAEFEKRQKNDSVACPQGQKLFRLRCLGSEKNVCDVSALALRAKNNTCKVDEI